jgi:hypothetical protein
MQPLASVLEHQILRDAAEKINAFKAQLDTQQNDGKIADALMASHHSQHLPPCLYILRTIFL